MRRARKNSTIFGKYIKIGRKQIPENIKFNRIWLFLWFCLWELAKIYKPNSLLIFVFLISLSLTPSHLIYFLIDLLLFDDFSVDELLKKWTIFQDLVSLLQTIFADLPKYWFVVFTFLFFLWHPVARVRLKMIVIVLRSDVVRGYILGLTRTFLFTWALGRRNTISAFISI